MEKIKKAAKEYQESLYYWEEYCEDSFIAGVKSEIAKEYWIAQISQMMKEQLGVHFTSEYLNNSFNQWLKTKTTI